MAIYTPKNNAELSAIVTGTGDTILLQSGVTYSASAIPAGFLSPSNVTLGVTGDGDLPIISGGVIRSDWTFDPTYGVYSRPAYPGNTLGNVTEDGVGMKFVAWNTDLATTAAAMVSGQDLPRWSGSMTYDPATFTVYIKPSSGIADQHEYVVSEILNGIFSTATNSNLWIEGIDFRHLSRHALTLFNKTNLNIHYCNFEMIGGVKPSSLWLGNGIELSKGVWGAHVSHCSFADIFDSAVTSQLYEGVPTTIGSHKWERITASRCGLTVVEISCQTGNQTIYDVETVDVYSNDHGRGWSGDRNGAVISHLSQGPTSKVTRSFARNINGNVQRRLYIGYQHGGICGIEDSTGVGSYFSGPNSSLGSGLPNQVDLMRNVTDNLARVGTQWVDSTANMQNSFRGSIL